MSILAEMFKSRRPGGVSSSGIAAAGSRPQLQLITGNANSELASEIAARLGVPLTPAKIARFPDGEVSIQILENVRCAARRNRAQFCAIFAMSGAIL